MCLMGCYFTPTYTSGCFMSDREPQSPPPSGAFPLIGALVLLESAPSPAPAQQRPSAGPVNQAPALSLTASH